MELSSDSLASVRVFIPAIPTQCAIADYLDIETTLIDTLITKKQRIIEATNQRLLLVAHELTTAAGRTIKLRRLTAQIKTGTTPPENQLGRLSDGDVPWYSPGDVGSWLSLRPAARTLTGEAVIAKWVPSFPAESTLIVGIGATAGRVAHLQQKASGNQQMTCIVPNSSIMPRFLSWQLLARTEELRATAPFTTLPILNNDFLKTITIVVPAMDQQIAILSQLDEQANRAQRLVQTVEAQIGLLKERQQALITAAVTGELDIPGLAK